MTKITLLQRNVLGTDATETGRGEVAVGMRGLLHIGVHRVIAGVSLRLTQSRCSGWPISAPQAVKPFAGTQFIRAITYRHFLHSFHHCSLDSLIVEVIEIELS